MTFADVITSTHPLLIIYRMEARLNYRPYMDYSSCMETIIFRTAAMLGFRRLQSYMLPCLYALLLLC